MISGLLSLAGAAILVVIDQLIKHWATAALLPVGSMDVLPGVVELRYCLNDGMAFSMLAGKQGLLIGMTSVMLLAVLIMLFVRKMPLTERAAWTLVLGGGVGNLMRVPAYLLPKAPTGTAAFIDPTAVTVWESGGPTQLSNTDPVNIVDQCSV